jgi:hypothetical protein
MDWTSGGLFPFREVYAQVFADLQTGESNHKSPSAPQGRSAAACKVPSPFFSADAVLPLKKLPFNGLPFSPP